MESASYVFPFRMVFLFLVAVISEESGVPTISIKGQADYANNAACGIERVGINSKESVATSSLATAPESYSDVGILRGD